MFRLPIHPGLLNPDLRKALADVTKGPTLCSLPVLVLSVLLYSGLKRGTIVEDLELHVRCHWARLVGFPNSPLQALAQIKPEPQYIENTLCLVTGSMLRL